MATAVPAELKPITAYLTRANELAKADGVMSYWCTYYALQHAMTLKPQEPASNEFLFGLMDKLEAMKVELATNETVTDDAAASAYIETFALRVFTQADNEDRAGKATRATAKKFLAASNFLELLSLFLEQDPTVNDKVKYSKWKASDIAKAFREGRTPVPGPAGGLSEEEKLPEAVEGDVTADEAKELAREFAALEAKERGAEDATPAEAEPESYPFPVLPTSEPSAPPADEEVTTPTVASATNVDVEAESEAHTPAFPDFLDTPQDLPRTPQPPAAPAPESHQTAELPTPPPHLNSAPPAFPAAVFPPSAPQPPSLPPPPPQPIYAAPPPAPIPTRAPAPVAVDQGNLPTSLDPTAITKIQKHAKWAISALNYDDLVTARKELTAALNALNGVN